MTTLIFNDTKSSAPLLTYLQYSFTVFYAEDSRYVFKISNFLNVYLLVSEVKQTHR